jgi:hypothetical protein
MISRVLLTLSLFAFLGAQFTFAADPAASLPECSKIVSACESQGYMPGEHKKGGKGLWIDCIDAIAKGKTVPGVSGFTADDAKACEKAAKASRQPKKAAPAPAGK